MEEGGRYVNLSELLSLVAPDGIWAILSFWLIFYIMSAQDKRDKKQEEREQKYQSIISDLTDSLKDLQSIKDILKERI